MSLVVFPFKAESPAVIKANFETAAGHGRVEEVWGVAASRGAALDRATELAQVVSSALRVPVDVFPQDRIGSFRRGKGDGMNTAIRRAVERGFGRIHFYDADITNFGANWIDGAETAADRGFEIVRHRFPRASTDAMITWMITRPSLAKLFPGTILPRLGQPLGGELLISGDVARRLSEDDFVTARSDWGIDTVITHATATMGIPLYEHNVAEGKRHALYGSLDEIRAMVVECLDAVGSLGQRDSPSPQASLEADPPSPVPEDLKRTVGYDVESTTGLLSEGWTEAEVDLVGSMGPDLAPMVLRNRAEPSFSFMDSETWGRVLDWLLDSFRLEEPAWRALAFRLWLMRVLSYTASHVPQGYDHAMEYLEGTIDRYEKSASRGQ